MNPLKILSFPLLCIFKQRPEKQKLDILQRKLGLVFYRYVTNYHKLSGLKLHPLFITQFAGEKSGYVVHGFLTQRLTSQLKVSVSCILMWSPQVCGRIWFLTFIGLRSPFPSWLIVKGSSQFLEMSQVLYRMAPSSSKPIMDIFLYIKSVSCLEYVPSSFVVNQRNLSAFKELML